MKKHQVGIFALLLLSCLATDAFAALKKGGESGCYQINSAEDLKEFSKNLKFYKSTSCFELTADITLNENLLADNGTLNPESTENPYDVWEPIGGSDYDFKGTFDGAGHTISGLYVNDPEKRDIGLFSFVDGATIKNVGVVDSYFRGKSCVGGLVGYAVESTISNSYNVGSVSATGDDGNTVGGLVGYAEDVTISNSYNTGSVSATGKESRAGGLIGHSYSAKIINSYNVGASTGDAIVGYTFSSSDLSNVFYLNTASTKFNEGNGAISASAEEFGNGTVALKLHNYIGNEANGLIWGQAITDGSLPDFSGKLDLDDFNTIALVTNGSTIQKLYYKPNENFTMPNNIGKDYIFIGEWFNDEKLQDPVTSETIKVTKDLTFYAKAITAKIPSTDKYGCYQISNASELYGFANLVNGGKKVECANLTKHIVVNEGNVSSESTGLYPWEPIGTFGGTFDGAGHTISGLYVNEPEKEYVGFFGEVSDGTIKNVGIVNSYFNGKDYVGGLIGTAEDATISKSYNAGSVSATGKKASIGGLVGGAEYEITISNSYNAGSVSATGKKASIGGLVGDAEYVTISNCYNAGSVSATGEEAVVGGLVGTAEEATISNSYNVVSSIGDAIVGNIDDEVTLNNVFYLESANTQYKEDGAISATAAEFGNGTMALKLHNYTGDLVNGSIWGQEKTGDGTFPDFSGKLNVDGLKTITLVANGSIVHKQYYKVGESFTLPKYIDEDYAFTGEWFSDVELKNKVTSETIEVAKDLTFYAKAITPKIPNTDGRGCLQISDASELYGFAKLVNEDKNVKCAVLTKDIVVNEGKVTPEGSGLYPWTPIGTYPYYFSGIFEGANHTVSGLYVNDPDKDEAGLFGEVSDGTIKNVGVVNSYFNAADDVGGLIGYVSETTISNCYNTGSMNATDEDADIGGLVGKSVYITISNCYNTGIVSTTGKKISIGGLVGSGSGVTINNSYNVGSSVGDAIVGYKGNYGVTLNNVFYLATETTQFKDDAGAKSATAAEFGDGTVAEKLNNYKNEDAGVDGTIWGQSEYGDGKYPDHSGIKNMKFAISYYDENGEFLKTQNVLYGEIPAFGDGAPTKESTAQYSYKLVWSPELKAVTGDADYTATFKEVPRTYKVTLNVSGGTLASKLESYTYGTGATLPTATRKGYTFEGWFANAKFSGTKQTAIGKDATGDKEFFAKWGKDAEVVDGSSSSAKPAGSSDSKPNVVASVAKQYTAVRLSIAGRNVQIAGARVGSAYAVLDLQGRVMQRGTVNHANFSIAMPRSGRFLVRIGSYVQQVNMR